MKQIKIKNLALLLIISAPLFADNCSNSVAPYFSIRSQSVNQPRMMAGWVDHVNRFDMEKFYGSFAVTPGYSQSFRDESIARCLFGNSLQNCDCPTIKISGSRVADRGNCDWLADYFGLPTDFQSSVTFKPKIKNFFIDFALHIGLDEWVSGMWFRVWAPFVHTRWDLDWCESCPASAGTLPHDPGYFNGVNGVTRANLLQNAREFFQERKTPNLGNGGGSAITFESLKSCRWGDCGCDTDLTENGLADLRFALGWNFFQDEDYHIGLGIIAAAPTGNRPDGCFLFEPIVGNGNHWEVGGLWTSHVIFWRSEDDEKHFGGYLDANITHLFKTRQKRCFDLCGKPLSRYMLAEKLATPVSGLWGNTLSDPDGGVASTSTAPSAQFKNAFAPVGNLTCSDVDVSVGVQADVVAMINYTCGGFSWDLGYNLWARSCEKIEFDCTCLPRLAKEANTWALKGDAHVYGFNGTGSNNETALSGTQSLATIHKGTNNFVGPNINVSTNSAAGINGVGPTRNPGVDNPRFTQTTEDNSGDPINDRVLNSMNPSPMNTKTSVDPIFINKCDINLQGARTKGLSHSLFTHFSYSWLDNEDWTPFLGIGAQAEFSNNSGSDCNKCCPTSCDTSCPTNCDTSCPTSSCDSCCDANNNCSSCCDSCQRCSVSQFYIWVKGGISFN